MPPLSTPPNFWDQHPYLSNAVDWASQSPIVHPIAPQTAQRLQQGAAQLGALSQQQWGQALGPEAAGRGFWGRLASGVNAWDTGVDQVGAKMIGGMLGMNPGEALLTTAAPFAGGPARVAATRGAGAYFAAKSAPGFWDQTKETAASRNPENVQNTLLGASLFPMAGAAMLAPGATGASRPPARLQTIEGHQAPAPAPISAPTPSPDLAPTASMSRSMLADINARLVKYGARPIMPGEEAGMTNADAVQRLQGAVNKYPQALSGDVNHEMNLLQQSFKLRGTPLDYDMTMVHEPTIEEVNGTPTQQAATNNAGVRTNANPAMLTKRWGVDNSSIAATDANLRGMSADQSQQYINKLTDAYRQGQPVDPVIETRDANNNIVDVDGRHRAFAAHQAGVKQIPVIVRRLGVTASSPAELAARP